MIVINNKSISYVIVPCEEIATPDPGDILVYQAFRTLFPNPFDLGYAKYYLDCAVLRFDSLANEQDTISRAINFRNFIRKRYLEFLASPDGMHYLYKISNEDYTGIVQELDAFYNENDKSYYDLFLIPTLKDEYQNLIDKGGDYLVLPYNTLPLMARFFEIVQKEKY